MLNNEQLAQLATFKNSGDPVGYYSLLKSFGVGYASLALGVASDATSGSFVADFGGLFAINYLKEKFQQYNGRAMSETEVQSVKVGLMTADFALRTVDDVSAEDIANYHYDVFVGLGIPQNAWTGDTLHRRIDDAAWCLTCGTEELGPDADNPLTLISQGIQDFRQKFSAEDWTAFVSDALYGKVLAKTLFEYGTDHPLEATIAAVMSGVAVALVPTLTSVGVGALALGYMAPVSWNSGLAVGALLNIDPSISVETAMRLIDGAANSYSPGTETIACFNAIRAQLPAACVAEFDTTNFADRALDFIKALHDGGQHGSISSPLTSPLGSLATLARTDENVRSMLELGLPFSITWLGEPSSQEGSAYDDFPAQYWADRETWLRGVVADNVAETTFATGETRYVDRALGLETEVGSGILVEKNVVFNGNGYAGSEGEDHIYGTAQGDSFAGGIGRDWLWGAAGDDWLGFTAAAESAMADADQDDGDDFFGGRGNDRLSGSLGSDTYHFGAGDGQDTVWTHGGSDLLALEGTGTTEFKRDGIDLLAYGASTSDFVRVKNWFTPGTRDNQLATVTFDGGQLSGNAISSQVLHVEGTDNVDVFDGVSGYADVINGNGGDDVIDVSVSGEFKVSDEVHGGDGNDEVTAGDSNDFLYGDAGDDVLDGGTGNDHLEGGSGVDALYSWGGASDLDGGAGDDFVFSQGTGSVLKGGDGDDYVYAKGGQNSLLGGAGLDTMRTRGNNLTADAGVDDDFLWDQGNNNHLFGGAGNDYFSLEGAGAVAHGGSGVDFFDNYGIGTTLDGGADNDFYYSANSSINVVMSTSSGHDTLQMEMPSAGVVRVSGVLSGEITHHLDGTSLVLSAGASSLTILNYVVDGAVNPNFEGIELDDTTVPTSELPQPTPPDTSTLWGTGASDTLVGNGIAYRIIGMGGNDTLFGSGASETFEWSQGDGLDTVWAQSSDVVSFEGSGYGVSAHRSGDDLALSASTGGGYVIHGWFTGENRPSVRAPDGSIWTPSQIDSQFSDAVYDISYSTGVYRVEDALPMLLSYCPSLDGIGLFGNNRTNYNATPDILADALANSMYGEEHVDSAGQTYKTWSAPIVDDVFTDGLYITLPYWGGVIASEESGTYNGGAFASARGSLEWDYWTDSTGQGYIALTSAASSVQTGFQWVVPPSEENPDWHVGKYYNGSYTGPVASSVREVEVLAPRVDDFVLYEGGSAGAMAMMAAYESATALGEGAMATTGEVAVGDFPLFQDAALVAAQTPNAGALLQNALSVWQSALQRIGEVVTAPAQRSLPAEPAAAASSAAVPEQRVSTGYLAQPEFEPARGADPLAYFFRDTGGVPTVGLTDNARCYIQPYPSTSNDFRLAA